MEDKKFENGNENGNATAPVATKTDKPGVFKKIGSAIASPFVWIGRKIKESPAATGLGMVIGSGLTLAAKKGIEYFVTNRSSGIPNTNPNPAEPQNDTTE